MAEGRKARRGLPGRCLISELACLCVGAKQRRCRRAGAASVGSMVCLQKGHDPVGVPGGLWGSSEELSPLSFSQDVEQRDPRGRSLLHLAVSLGYVESVRVLLRHKADVTKENAQGWTGEPPAPPPRGGIGAGGGEMEVLKTRAKCCISVGPKADLL